MTAHDQPDGPTVDYSEPTQLGRPLGCVPAVSSHRLLVPNADAGRCLKPHGWWTPAVGSGRPPDTFGDR